MSVTVDRGSDHQGIRLRPQHARPLADFGADPPARARDLLVRHGFSRGCSVTASRSRSCRARCARPSRPNTLTPVMSLRSTPCAARKMSAPARCGETKRNRGVTGWKNGESSSTGLARWTSPSAPGFFPGSLDGDPRPAVERFKRCGCSSTNWPRTLWVRFWIGPRDRDGTKPERPGPTAKRLRRARRRPQEPQARPLGVKGIDRGGGGGTSGGGCRGFASARSTPVRRKLVGRAIDP